MKNFYLISIGLLMFYSTLFGIDKITIDAKKMQPPISKYIYGQFIEQLGRCINGGLWSEMILDRKFFFPITQTYDPWGVGQPDSYWGGSPFLYLKASPWQVIGPEGTVTMDSLGAYTKHYSVVIHLAGNGSTAGIRQPGLTLVAGKSYSGKIILSSDETALPIQIRLVNQDSVITSQVLDSVTTDFASYPLLFECPVSCDSTELEIISTGSGQFKIGTISLKPSNNINGWRADLVELLKQLDSPVYRWPGGNFVSGYNWQDGVGDPDLRPTKLNPAWIGIEPNDVGIHEFIDLMTIINSEPYIAVNMGLGTVEAAAAEVEYCNGAADTPMGQLRSQNGHTEPFAVKFWAVGNEMYGTWQLGYMPISDYIVKQNQAAGAMYKVDSTIQLVAVGSVVSNWSKPMLEQCSDYMDLISEHMYCKEIIDPYIHANQIASRIKVIAYAHRSYRNQIPGLAEKDIDIAFDEYNYWYGDWIYGELGCRYHLKDALGIANSLHEFFRNSDLFFMANYAQTVNVLGLIKSSATNACFAATALPLVLYRHHFGTIPLEISGKSKYLNIVAALSEDKLAFTLAVVNAKPDIQQFVCNIENAEISRDATTWTITHTDPMAYNEPGKPLEVDIVEKRVSVPTDTFAISPYSIILYEFDVESLVGVKSKTTHQSGFEICQNYPNPFNATTKIEFRLPITSQVEINVYNMLGQEIRTLVDKALSAGSHVVIWDGTDNSGETVSSGLYLYSMKSGNFLRRKKGLFLK